MKRPKSLVTLWLVSIVLLAPGIAGAQVSKTPFGAIQTQLTKLQEQNATLQDQNLILKEQIGKLSNDMNQILLSSILTQLSELREQIANLPPAWSRKLPAPERFVVLAEFNNEAVLDKETGLVWQALLSTEPQYWGGAEAYCNTLSVNGRKGWRLPTIQELTSLVDPSQSNPALPIGHPFQNVQSSYYWSATTDATNSIFAWDVNFSDGEVLNVDTSWWYETFMWCVRGGQGVDPQ